MTCSNGTWWNPTLWNCDHLDKSGCTAKPDAPCHDATTAQPKTSKQPEYTTLEPVTTHSPVTTTSKSPVNTTVRPKTSLGPKSTARPQTTFEPVTTDSPVTTTAKPSPNTTVQPKTSSGPTTTPVRTTLDPNGCKPTCPFGKVMFFPDVRDCTKYWQCGNGIAYHMQCGPGTNWNPTVWTCDYPQNAGCTAKPDAPCHPKSTTVETVTTTMAPPVLY